MERYWHADLRVPFAYELSYNMKSGQALPCRANIAKNLSFHGDKN